MGGKQTNSSKRTAAPRRTLTGQTRSGRLPLGMRHPGPFTGGVENDDQRSPDASAGAVKGHGDTAAHHHALASLDPDVPLRRLQALFAFQNHPGLRARMSVDLAAHPWRKRRFHERCRVRSRRKQLERPHGCYPAASVCGPTRSSHGQQPGAAISLHDSALPVPRTVCVGRRGKLIDVPVERLSRRGRNRDAGKDPASQSTLPPIHRLAPHLLRLGMLCERVGARGTADRDSRHKQGENFEMPRSPHRCLHHGPITAGQQRVSSS
jgi:hypothetical protein